MTNYADLKTIAPDGNSGMLTSLASRADAVLVDYLINTPLRLAHFWAQAAHESDGFKTMQEYASGAGYEGRADLGNTQRGDGVRYKGRGIFQLTGRANYRRLGKVLGLDLEGNPEFAAIPENALKIAGEYWREHNLNAAADLNDIRTITYKINGGYNGLASRKAYFARAWGVFGGRKSAPDSPQTKLAKKAAGAVVIAIGAGASHIANAAPSLPHWLLPAVAFAGVGITGWFLFKHFSKGP